MASPDSKPKEVNLPMNSILRKFAWAFFFAGYLMAENTAQGIDQATTWKSICLANDLISLKIVPDIGGRIMNFSLEDYQYLLVNDELENTIPPAARVAPDGSWLNYGGDKLWVAPQGKKGPEQWPGPPDPVLDGGPYEAAVVETADGRPTAIELRSGKTASSGVQLSRTIRIFNNTSRVSFEAHMLNVDTIPRRWGIWAHTQLNGRNRNGEGHNPNYFAYCPLNPESVHSKGYWIMFGPEDNPSFRRDDRNGFVIVQYLRKIGKIGVDSAAGWVAVVDGTAGYVFVQRFTHLQGREYPDKATVEFWADGYRPVPEGQSATGQKDPGYGLESELIGPYESLEPGESASFRYDWYAAAIGGNYRIWDCNPWAVTCSRLTGGFVEDKVKLSGRFGVFYKGRIELIARDKAGSIVYADPHPVMVTPAKPFVVENSNLGAGLKAGSGAVEIVLVLKSVEGEVLGEIARTRLGTL